MIKQFGEIIERAVYCGRKRLGRFAQTQKERFEAFDSEDRRLGIFKSRAEALAAIEAAQAASALAEDRRG